jgi:hypothetical protein
MTIDIKAGKLKIVLSAIKEQHINVSIKSRFGGWSKEYYKINDLQEIENAATEIVLVVLQSGCCSSYAVVDLNSIYGLKFNKYLNLDGHLISELKVIFAPDSNPVLQL